MNLSKEEVIKLAKKNYRYIIAVILVLMLVVILFKGIAEQGKNEDSNTDAVSNNEIITSDEVELEAQQDNNDYKVDEYPEVNELVEQYFTALTDGEITNLKKIISPFEKPQQKLVKKLSKYIESYNNIKCYTKIGPIENSYMVSVYHDTKFKNIDTMAPGLTTLYIHTNDSGVYYIDNRSNDDLEPEVVSFDKDFLVAQDVLDLKKNVDKKAQEALASDSKLKKFVEGTYQELYVDYYTLLNADSKTQDDSDSNDEEKTQKQDASNKKDTSKKDKKETQDNNKQEESTQTESTASTNTQYYNAGDSIRLSSTINIRKSMDESSDRVVVAYEGETVTVVMSYAEGWTKVELSGKTGFVKTELLQ